MNKELDELLCLLDGKITAYRMKETTDPKDIATFRIWAIQKELQDMWKNNRGV